MERRAPSNCRGSNLDRSAAQPQISRPIGFSINATMPTGRWESSGKGGKRQGRRSSALIFYARRVIKKTRWRRAIQAMEREFLKLIGRFKFSLVRRQHPMFDSRRDSFASRGSGEASPRLAKQWMRHQRGGEGESLGAWYFRRGAQSSRQQVTRADSRNARAIRLKCTREISTRAREDRQMITETRDWQKKADGTIDEMELQRSH